MIKRGGFQSLVAGFLSVSYNLSSFLFTHHLLYFSAVPCRSEIVSVHFLADSNSLSSSQTCSLDISRYKLLYIDLSRLLTLLAHHVEDQWGKDPAFILPDEDAGSFSHICFSVALWRHSISTWFTQVSHVDLNYSFIKLSLFYACHLLDRFRVIQVISNCSHSLLSAHNKTW